MLKLVVDNAVPFLNENLLEGYSDKVISACSQVYERSGLGSNYLGWVHLPSKIDETCFFDIEKVADRFRRDCECIVVIGIGGSYLGSRAVTEALKDPFVECVPNGGEQNPQMIFAGNNLSEKYLVSLLSHLDSKKYGVVVISKSGTTTEPAIAFRLIRKHLEEKEGVDYARTHIIAITDPEAGALRQMSEQEGYAVFSIPEDVGGRYSVLSHVGLLPLAMAGVDIRQLIAGAEELERFCVSNQNLENPVNQYAALRNALYKKGKKIEILVTYCPELRFMTEWWKQLFGESEGKDAKGIFPASVIFTTDLHSLGQLIQDGERNIFETVLSVKQSNSCLKVPEDKTDLDGLNYLAGMSVHEINQKAQQGAKKAHCEGGVPNIGLEIERLDAYHLGQLIYFFEMSCAMSGYILGVNPFDQPGVEAYKRNMFELLGKPS